ncbi:MAG: biotin--[acetyl-CoA-carboxylase] ligase [Gemmatimonadota bacterium]|nr:biotin--[acetyl-CoA-carboxylase] ligase [Gemmatimonadota bacterium]
MSAKRAYSSKGSTGFTGVAETPIAYRVLELLGKERTTPVPVRDIAVLLSCRTADVLGAVEAMRRLGYSVSDCPGAGIRLATETDVIVRSRLLDGLGPRVLGRSPVCFLELDSTNAVATRAALTGAAHGTVVLAEHQRAGRGRLGRNWFSPPGVGLWFSLILRYDLTASRAWMLTLGAAVALADAVEAATGVCPDVRWPNDLYLNDRKLAGILTEVRGRDDRLDFAVLGIGINVNQEEADFPASLQDTATSLRCGTGRTHDRTAFLAEALRALEQVYAVLDAERIRKLWTARARMPGKRVCIMTHAGPVRGVAEDVGTDGALLVRGADGGVRRVLGGDVGDDTSV